MCDPYIKMMENKIMKDSFVDVHKLGKYGKGKVTLCVGLRCGIRKRDTCFIKTIMEW